MTLRPAQHHTLEEMDSLLQAVNDSLVAARTAIDAYTNERLQWVSDNGPEYRSAFGAAYRDARQVQDAIARMIDLTVLPFHPDRVNAADAYGSTLAEIMDGLRLNTPAMRSAFGEEPPPPPPPPVPPPPPADDPHSDQHEHGRHKKHHAA